MPKTYLFSVVFTLLLLFSSCVAEVKDINIPAPGIGIESEYTTLNIFISQPEHPKTGSLDVWQEIADSFTEENPNVSIEFNIIGQSRYKAALRAKLDGSGSPDIFMIDGEDDLSMFADKLEGLQTLMLQDVLPGVLGSVRVEDEIFGFPISLTGYGFLYNTEIFGMAGLDANDFEIFDALEKMIGELENKIFAGSLSGDFPELITTFSMGEKSNWAKNVRIENFILPFEFDTPEKLRKAERFDFVYNERLHKIFSLINKNSKNAAGTYPESEFAKKTAAAIMGDTSMLYEIYKQNPNIEIAFAPIVINNWRQRSVPLGCNGFFAVNSSVPAANKIAAANFLQWLFSPDGGGEFLTQKLFWTPPYQSILQNTQNRIAAQIYQYYRDGAFIPQTASEVHMLNFYEKIQKSITEYAEGREKWQYVVEYIKSSFAYYKN